MPLPTLRPACTATLYWIWANVELQNRSFALCLDSYHAVGLLPINPAPLARGKDVGLACCRPDD